jgi:HEAT repeat protein
MGVLDSYKVNRTIEALLSTQEVPAAERRQALAQLAQLADRAVPRLIERLSDPQAPAEVAELLLGLLSDGTLPLFVGGLSSPDSRVASRVAEVLSRGSSYDPNRLLAFLQSPEVSKARIAEVLASKKQLLDPQALLRLLDSIDKEQRSLVLRLVDEAATESVVPELTRRTSSEDWLVRLYLARTLARFGSQAARDALTALLADSHKSVRQAALEGLGAMKIPVDVAAICGLLRDPDLTVQAKAIETIAQLNDPRAVRHLLDVLQDDSEYVRRAAVEVLNQVGNTDAIKDLLGALRDRDWWVRVRAADALGSIGGPKVVEAVLALVKDKDEFIRRCAIEILNTTRTQGGEERTLNSLVGALDDEDWWVRERAIDALARIGDRRAVPALLQVMERDSKAAPVAIRALAGLGDAQAIPALLAQLRRQDQSIRREAIRALAALADEAHAEVIQRALAQLRRAGPDEVRDLADQALQSLTARFGDRQDEAEATAGGATVASRSLLHGQGETAGWASLIAEPKRREPSGPSAGGGPAVTAVDASLLEPGMVLAERYQVRRPIGSGAFGVVVLVEDLVVHEEIILKFLKPHVASDERVIKRFIQELRYARRITHENVIRIYDFLTIGTSYAISMEYFPSQSLMAELKRGEPLPPARAFTILRGICRGMSVAHRAGIIHRDLKPANVLLGEADLVKIVDFGVAGARSGADTALTGAGMIVGTPTYMAPEQAQGRPCDPRTDIYSLGVIMYELFVGRPPYQGPDPMAVLLQHVQGAPTPPRKARPGLPAALEATILRAMAVKPEGRFQRMEDLERAVDILAGSGEA